MEDLQGGGPVLGELSQDYSNKENEIVGLDRDLERIKDHLTRGLPHQKTISIVGMGGIGKTTLARRLFNDPSIVHYFHICLWVTVTQEYQIRKVLISLLSGPYLVNEHILHGHDLGEIVYKNLKGRRYLVVMDDVWSTKFFDEVIFYLPNDMNGSRILVTSRLTNVAKYPNTEVLHDMNFLNLEDGWKLFHQKLFGKEKFPLELEEIGRKIVRECGGLPLAITVAAGILCKVSRTPECWTKVAESVGPHLTEDPEQCLNIIGWSYNHLPSRLKDCFLYMGAFPADFEIPSQRLIRLWIAEGFLDDSKIKNLEGKNLEEEAEKCLEDLMGSHLILVRKGSLGRIKTCYMHDLLRDFCLREAKSKNFLRHFPDASHEGINYPTRVILHSCDSSFNLSAPHIRSLLCYQNLFEDFFVRHKGFKLLTVLDFFVSRFHCFPLEIIQLVNLRYLALSINEGLPPSISDLRNLQVLILNHGLRETILPREIWSLSQLRHLQCNDICILQDPSGAENDGKGQLLSNLQTLSTLSLSSCTLSVFAALPNLKKLRICETEEADTIEQSWWSYFWYTYNDGSIFTINNLCSNLDNVGQLHQLETLKLIFLNTFNREPQWIPHLDAFPPNIKKLTLSFSYLPWEDMKILCMLRNLEVLKLKNNAFIGKEWEQHEGRFNKLKLLLLESIDLERWESASDHFPCLKHLVLKFCRLLQNIPLDIGEIHTLQIIEVHGCSYSAAMSAEKIQLELQSMGNDALDVRISMTDDIHDLQLEERIFSSVSALSDPSGVRKPHRVIWDFQGNIKSLMVLGLAVIVIWVTSWESFPSNIKKMTLLGLVGIIIWKTSRS